MSHTPGPWTPKYRHSSIGSGFFGCLEFVAGPDGKEICGAVSFATEFTEYATLGQIRDEPFRRSFRPGEPFPYSANARLIAAAPDLLEAARKALRAIEISRHGNRAVSDNIPGDVEPDLRSAIAKALGQEVPS